MRPAFRIRADEEDVTRVVADRLVRLEITDEAGIQSDLLSLDLDDRSPYIALPRTGAELQVELGWGEALYAMGTFVADEVEVGGPPARLGIRARAANVSGQPTASGRRQVYGRASRAWADATLGQVLGDLADALGSPLRIDDDVAATPVAGLVQLEESDANLLTRIARTYGLVAAPKGGQLVVTRRGSGLSAQGDALPEVEITPGECSRFRVTFTERGQYSGVEAHWHDVASGARRTETAGASDGPTLALRRQYPDAATARAAAEARSAALARGAGSVAVTLSKGNPRLSAEARIRLQGFRPGIGGTWGVKRVRHILTAEGYTTAVDAEVA